MPVRRCMRPRRTRSRPAPPARRRAAARRRRRREIVIVVPRAAASSSMPMMLLPSISRPCRATRIRDSKPRRQMDELRRRPRVQAQLVHDGDRARRHAAAWFVASQQDPTPPRSRSAMVAHLARHREQVGELAERRELDQHRQVDAGDDLDAAGFEKRHAQVRRRAAEHVGQQQHAARRRAPARSPARCPRARRSRRRASRSTRRRTAAGRRRSSRRR